MERLLLRLRAGGIVLRAAHSRETVRLDETALRDEHDGV